MPSQTAQTVQTVQGVAVARRRSLQLHGWLSGLLAALMFVIAPSAWAVLTPIVTLTASSASMTDQDSAELSALVSDPSTRNRTAPSGTVSFIDDANNAVCAPVTLVPTSLAGGQAKATCTFAGLNRSGLYRLSASYNGDATFSSLTSAQVQITVVATRLLTISHVGAGTVVVTNSSGSSSAASQRVLASDGQTIVATPDPGYRLAASTSSCTSFRPVSELNTVVSFVAAAMSADCSLAFTFAAQQPTLLLAYDRAAQRVLSFSPNNPATVLTSVALTGLTTGERLLDIAMLPQSSTLYSLASDSTRTRIVTVSSVNGAVVDVSGTPTLASAGSASYGLSIVPGGSALRVVADNGSNQNLQLAWGGLSSSGLPACSYVAGDAGVGSTPALIHVAFTTSNQAGDYRTLFAIDQARGTLVAIDPDMRVSTLTTVGSLGLAPGSLQAAGGLVTTPGSLFAFAALRINGVSILHRVNLINGAATAIGEIGSGSTIDGLALAATSQACLDVDGDGSVRAETDGLMLLRALLGFSGDAALSGLQTVPPAPRANWAAIATYMNATCGTNFVGGAAPVQSLDPCLDLDGDGTARAHTDGMIWLRTLLGMSGEAALTGLKRSPAAPRATWATISDHINRTCAMNLGGYSPVVSLLNSFGCIARTGTLANNTSSLIFGTCQHCLDIIAMRCCSGEVFSRSNNNCTLFNPSNPAQGISCQGGCS